MPRWHGEYGDACVDGAVNACLRTGLPERDLTCRV
jgi:hypothetical protein